MSHETDHTHHLSVPSVARREQGKSIKNKSLYRKMVRLTLIDYVLKRIV